MRRCQSLLEYRVSLDSEVQAPNNRLQRTYMHRVPVYVGWRSATEPQRSLNREGNHPY